SNRSRSEMSFESVPRRIYLDSCTVQTMRKYGEFIYEGIEFDEGAPILKLEHSLNNVRALRVLFLVNDRAQFEWIVSTAGVHEALDKRDKGHMQWVFDILDHSNACLDNYESSDESVAL